MIKKSLFEQDINTIKFQNIASYAFIISSIIGVISSRNILILVIIIVVYLLSMGTWSIVSRRYYRPAGGELGEKMYKGNTARLIGLAHLVFAIIFVYYLW